MTRTIKYIVFYLLLLLTLLPAIQKKFRLFKVKALSGDFKLAERPALTWDSWNNGKFQSEFDDYLEEHIGFRNFFIRLQNQLDFSLYRKANAEGVVIGKKDYLYEYDYIRAYTGLDYVGNDFIRKKLGRLKFLQNYLKKNKNIDLELVFEPGKASFYPEYIPDKYLEVRKDSTNYQTYTSTARDMGIHFIDLNKYLIDLKSKEKYPLFPKYGTHWSIYGMSFGADSILNYIQDARDIELPAHPIDTIEYSWKPRATDYDVARTMNLLFQLPAEKLAYPHFDLDTNGKGTRPMVLTIADSYYWNIFNTGIPKYLYANQAFWYFGKRVYPDFYYGEKYVSDLNLKDEIEKQDVIFLMVTERFLYIFDWGLIDRIYDLYTPDWLRDPVYENINGIFNYGPWFAEVIQKADKKNLSLGQMLEADGRYMLYKDNKADYLIRFGLEHYENIIRQDSMWMNNIRKKAAESGKTVDAQLQEDALYNFKNDDKDLYEINRGIAAKEEEIKNDSTAYMRAQSDAGYYGWPVKDYLQALAFKSYEDDQLKIYEHAILSDPVWLADVRAKALKKGLSLNEMIHLDAQYMFDIKRKKIKP